MVRNYKRKTTDRWSKEDLLKALVSIQDTTLKINEAARLFGISRATLYRQYGKFRDAGGICDVNQFRTCGGNPILTRIEEDVLEKTILDLRDQGFSVTSSDIKRICYEYCDSNGIANQFNVEKRMASDDWYYGFLKRHPNVRVVGRGITFNENSNGGDNHSESSSQGVEVQLKLSEVETQPVDPGQPRVIEVSVQQASPKPKKIVKRTYKKNLKRLKMDKPKTITVKTKQTKVKGAKGRKRKQEEEELELEHEEEGEGEEEEGEEEEEEEHQQPMLPIADLESDLVQPFEDTDLEPPQFEDSASHPPQFMEESTETTEPPELLLEDPQVDSLQSHEKIDDDEQEEEEEENNEDDDETSVSEQIDGPPQLSPEGCLPLFSV